ncbi:MAG: hypothetical protein ACJA04_000975, partial [Cellvibrionaceae bacterium]
MNTNESDTPPKGIVRKEYKKLFSRMISYFL